mmetsp:Transcript_38868/g.122501  ORF Transcript_38868/g.122501 Transcript_38868/m.122501 type:complete len:126 (-) Transcript_38868:276-653(-)
MPSASSSLQLRKFKFPYVRTTEVMADGLLLKDPKKFINLVACHGTRSGPGGGRTLQGGLCLGDCPQWASGSAPESMMIRPADCAVHTVLTVAQCGQVIPKDQAAGLPQSVGVRVWRHGAPGNARQ